MYCTLLSTVIIGTFWCDNIHVYFGDFQLFSSRKFKSQLEKKQHWLYYKNKYETCLTCVVSLCQCADSGSKWNRCWSPEPSPAGPHQTAAPRPTQTGMQRRRTPEPQTQMGRQQQCQEHARRRDGLQPADGGQEQKVSLSLSCIISISRYTAGRKIEFILKADCEQWFNLVKTRRHWSYNSSFCIFWKRFFR